MRIIPGICKKCNGLGVLEVEVEPFFYFEEVPCNICKKPKLEGERKEVTCEDCNGKGHIKVGRYTEPCKSCHAQGYLIYVQVSESYFDYKGECDE